MAQVRSINPHELVRFCPRRICPKRFSCRTECPTFKPYVSTHNQIAREKNLDQFRDGLFQRGELLNFQAIRNRRAWQIGEDMFSKGIMFETLSPRITISNALRLF